MRKKDLNEKSAMTNEDIALGDVYKGLWKCRDFEISHLWQRSIFLVTLLVLVFSGYGKLLEIYMGSDGKGLSPPHFHAFAVGLTCIGMVASTLWVCMAKASKAWQEKYENAINDFIDKFSENTGRRDIFVSRYAGFRFEELASEEKRYERWRDRERNRLPWRTGGSNFSPSRINIFIGQFTWCIWLVLSAVHLFRTFTVVGDHTSERLLCVGLAACLFLTLVLCGFLTLSRNHSPIATQGQ